MGLGVIESPGVDTLEFPADLKKKISLVDRELGTREAKRLKRVQDNPGGKRSGCETKRCLLMLLAKLPAHSSLSFYSLLATLGLGCQ
jgi:hypothetical protein